MGGVHDGGPLQWERKASCLRLTADQQVTRTESSAFRP